MKMRLLALVCMLAAVACATPEGATTSDGTWVGTITRVGDVTTVVNQAGSVWGGTAELVEEASIGIESGAEEYLLGRVGGVAADDERIYVLDSQLPAIRVYDLDGTHRRDIAPIGAGPGEFREPNGLVLSPAGTLYVTDFRNAKRVVAFDPDGTPLWTRTVTEMAMAAPLQAREDGVVTLRLGQGIGDVGPDGSISNRRPLPEIDMSAWSVRTAAAENWVPATFYVPKAPRAVWAVLPSGSLAASDSSAYRISIDLVDGGELIIERDAPAVPVQAAERHYYEQYLAGRLTRSSGIIEGEMPPIPGTKPYLSRMIGAQDGPLWVARPGPGKKVPGCADFSDPLEMMRNPCWVDETILDVFDADGRYLGAVDLPEGFKTSPAPFVRGDQVVAVVEDSAGTIMVKRYRLVPPSEH